MTTQTGSAVQSVIHEHASPVVAFLQQYLTVPFLARLIGTGIVILFIFIMYRIVLRAIKHIPQEHIKPHTALILERVTSYLFYLSVIMYILGLFGIKFSAIWGAAGVAGVAIGFAAQTSVSNVISGLFVMSDHAMKLGDFISVEGVSGTVDTINMLSVKIHTLDNQMVRVPNSTIINSCLINTSFYPQRRLTIGVSVSYDTDLKLALDTLKKVPALCPTVLSEPAASAWFESYGDSGIYLTLAVWFNSADYLQTKNDAFIAVKKVFDDAGISIPFNHLDVSVVGEVNCRTKAATR